MVPEEAFEVKQLLRDVWTATYPNKNEGISFDDVNSFFTEQMSAENVEKFRQKLSSLDAGHHYLVARMDGKIVGVSEMKIGDSENEFNIIAILPEYQGKGIGRALWNKNYELADHSKPITLYVAYYNVKAINFYKQLGFVEEGTMPVERELVFASGARLPEMRMVLR